MTSEQFERWRDFALRMARTCYATSRRPSVTWIEEVVRDFFSSIDDEDVPCIVDWDNSRPYRPGDRLYQRRYRCPCWHCRGSPRKSDCRYKCEDGEIYDYAAPYCMGDAMMEFLDEYRPSAPDCRACSDPDSDDECRCDEIRDHHYEQWDDQYGGPIQCCVRAGLDFAASPSAGVLGFTAGDVRRMYPEGVPTWLFPPAERLHHWPSGEPDGLFVELPDSAGIVL